jgi:hypothetical protein
MQRLHIAASAAFIAGGYSLVLAPIAVGRDLLREDGPIEQATAIFFFVTFCCFLGAWRLRAAEPEPGGAPGGRRIFFLLLALLMFLCAGEEISWGQRIFGWQTPAPWAAHNAQSETNLHNLTSFEGDVRASQPSFWRNFTNSNRLFSLFWLTFFVLVPVLDRVSAPARRLFRAVGLPIAPLWIGALFLLNRTLFYGASLHVFRLGAEAVKALPLDELKEQNDAFVYAVAGVAACVQARRGLRLQPQA